MKKIINVSFKALGSLIWVVALIAGLVSVGDEVVTALTTWIAGFFSGCLIFSRVLSS